MSNRVPFDVIQTGDNQLDRIQNNVAQAVRQLQEKPPSTQSLTTFNNVTVAKQSTITVTNNAIKSVLVTLPNQVPTDQTTRVVNQSAYPVQVRTADASTVFDDIAAGSSASFHADGSTWSQV